MFYNITKHPIMRPCIEIEFHKEVGEGGKSMSDIDPSSPSFFCFVTKNDFLCIMQIQ